MYKAYLLYYAALVGHFDLTGYKKHLNIKEIQETFSNVMEGGTYDETFIDILYPTSEYPEDFLPTLRKALESLNMEIPKSDQEAVYGIVRYHLTQIVEGVRNPIAGMLEIGIDLGYYDMAAPETSTWNFQGKDRITQEVADLVDICWGYRDEFNEMPYIISYKDCDGEEAIQNLEKDILQISKTWLNIIFVWSVNEGCQGVKP